MTTVCHYRRYWYVVEKWSWMLTKEGNGILILTFPMLSILFTGYRCRKGILTVFFAFSVVVNGATNFVRDTVGRFTSRKCQLFRLGSTLNHSCKRFNKLSPTSSSHVFCSSLPTSGSSLHMTWLSGECSLAETYSDDQRVFANIDGFY